MLNGWRLIFSARQANEPGSVLPRRPGAVVFMLGSSEPWELAPLLLLPRPSLHGEQAGCLVV